MSQMYHVVSDEDSDDDHRSTARTRPRGAKAKSYRYRCYALCIVLAILVVLAIVGGVLLNIYLHHTKQECLTPDVCNSNLLQYLDTSVDPCEDFYLYSCGGWLRDNQLGTRDAWGTAFYELIVDNYRHLRGYLSAGVADGDSEAIKKSKYMYSACADTAYIESNYKSHLRDVMIADGGWSSVDVSGNSDQPWSFAQLASEHYGGSSAYFSFYIAPDDLNSTNPVIRITQSGLTLESPELYDDDAYSLTYGISQILADVFDLFDDDAYGVASGIVDFETKLANAWMSETELRNVSALYNPMTLDELNDIAPFPSFLGDTPSWLEYFNSYFHEAGFSTVLTGDTVVIVNTLDYFKTVFGDYYFFYDIGVSEIEDYAKWQLFLNHFSLATASLDRYNWDILYKTKFPKSSRLSEQSSFACVELVEANMPMAVARPFVEEFISDELRNMVNETVDAIESSFIEQLMTKDWLDNVTKKRCIEKVDAITRQVAYPDFIKVDRLLDNFYENLNVQAGDRYFDIYTAANKFVIQTMLSQYNKPIDKTVWQSAPTEVNAYYDPTFNQFVFLAGILRPPFIATNYPPFLYIGAIGAVIGHELSHGFDDQGQLFNKDGNRVPWWTPESVANFKQRTQCFVDQYDNYELQGFQINGRLTLGENIADNGGLHTAYRAYRQVTNELEMNSTTNMSTSIKGHSLDQLFFISFAQLWCSEFSDDHLKQSTLTDPHSPGPIRVLGSITNSQEFTDAFQCPVGSRMNPSKKCVLW